jgi:hypothetical protein
MAANKTVPRGRKPGTLNKVTATAKEAIEFAGNKLGGGAGLYRWAMQNDGNLRIFWGQIWPKLLPLQLNASLSGDLTVVVRKFAEENQAPTLEHSDFASLETPQKLDS